MQQQNQYSLSIKSKAVTIGLIIAIIGCIAASAFGKETLTNNAGFIMLLIGAAISIISVFAIISSSLKTKFIQHSTPGAAEPTLLYLSTIYVGLGAALAVDGSIIASAYDQSTLINNVGFITLLVGITIAVLGFFGATIAALRILEHNGIKTNQRYKLEFFTPVIAVMTAGTTLTVIGSILTRSYAKLTLTSDVGYCMLLAGIAVLGICVTATVVAIVKARLDLYCKLLGTEKAHVSLVSIWAIGVGAMLILIGGLLAGAYEKSSILNYTGFGMLLSGTGVFVYGFFETARISLLDFVDRRNKVEYNKIDNKPLTTRLQKWGRKIVATRAVFNLIGVMTSLGLLFFSLWQLDLIVSGPVWWESSSTGTGWSWAGPGAYANDYFQCFLWKTTVGQAYDTFFLLIFIAFIVLFASAFFWPREKWRN